MLIIAPLPAPFPSVATHREREVARPNKPRSQVVTWMSVHMPMQRTYEGLQQRVINNLDIPILALCGLVAFNAQVRNTVWAMHISGPDPFWIPPRHGSHQVQNKRKGYW